MSNKPSSSRLAPHERREQIVRVAVEHFARHGYDAASVGKIAAEAGVTRALIYHYFPGKESLLGAVLKTESDALLNATAPDPEVSPQENLERALGAYLDHFSAASGGVRQLYVPHATSPSLVWELSAKNHVIQVDRLLTTLEVPGTPAMRLALGAWLAFVEECAREFTASGVPRAEVIRMCLEALKAVSALPL